MNRFQAFPSPRQAWPFALHVQHNDLILKAGAILSVANMRIHEIRAGSVTANETSAPRCDP